MVKMAMTRIALILLVLGLVVGVGAGYGVGFFVYQPQVSQLSSDLSDSQLEVESLEDQLTEAHGEILTLVSNLTSFQAELAALEAELAKAQEYLEFRANVTSLFDSLQKKLELESQMIKAVIYFQRNQTTGLRSIMMGLGQYVMAIGDDELSDIWDEYYPLLMAQEWALAYAKFADLMERNSMLVESDLSELEDILGS